MREAIKKTFTIFTALFLLFSFLLVPADFVFADTNTKIQHIYDKAELLSTAERTELEDMCTKSSQKDAVDIIIMTHNDSSAVYAEKYISDFYDKMLYKNCIILLVDMHNRDVYIEDYGKRARSKISSGKIDTIVDRITPSLSSGEYAEAFNKYIKCTDNYINQVPIYENVWVHLLAAIIIGAAAVAIMAYHAGGRMTVGGSTYIDSNDSGLIGRRDDYIRTQVTRIRKPENNGGGNGGGGGGISAGGNSYNGGGGKF